MCPEGVALLGLAHEAPIFEPGKPRVGMFDGLSTQFRRNLVEEPAFTAGNCTFCVWRLTADTRWFRGPVDLPAGKDPDGSHELLAILEGNPQQYVEFAASYFERDVSLRDVEAVYRHEPLDEGLLSRLNPELTLESVADDLHEFGYPDAG